MPNPSTLHTTNLATETARIRLTGVSWADVRIGDRVIVECADEVACGSIDRGPSDTPCVVLDTNIGPGDVLVRRPQLTSEAA